MKIKTQVCGKPYRYVTTYDRNGRADPLLHKVAFSAESEARCTRQVGHGGACR